jgi:hypothetical protein
MSLTGAQVRAVRELLGWSRVRLARAARVSASTIVKAEMDGPRMTDWAQRAIREAFERASVAFDEDSRITLRGGK